MKTKIYNLIILDESGSMSGVTEATIRGCNETLNTIRAAQQKFGDIQEHLVSIYAFQGFGSRPSRYLMRNKPVADVQNIGRQEYEPDGSTPLYDAIGLTLNELKAFVEGDEVALGSVTIITDGEENASRTFSGRQVVDLIEDLKKKGWNFSFIGANIDVDAMASRLRIENRYRFDQTERGTREMWGKHGRSRMNYNERIAEIERQYRLGDMEQEDREAILREASGGYFEEDDRLKEAGKRGLLRRMVDRAATKSKVARKPAVGVKCGITPEMITRLSPNQIFVFGSNIEGRHNGGAAGMALRLFGAIYGVGSGPQGHSYAIPTVHVSPLEMKQQVDLFVEYAATHPQLHFLVTRIGCGNGGYRSEDIAPLFAKAAELENVSLPADFIQILLC